MKRENARNTESGVSVKTTTWKQIGVRAACAAIGLCGTMPRAVLSQGIEQSISRAEMQARIASAYYMAPRGREPIVPLPPAASGAPGQRAEHAAGLMTLEKMIALVGERDPRVLVSELSARAAHERAAKAWAGHYPQLSVEYALGRRATGTRRAAPRRFPVSTPTISMAAKSTSVGSSLPGGRPKSAMRKPMRWRKPKKTGTGARGI